MKTALELLDELKDKLDNTTYEVQKQILEREKFKEEFESVFKESFTYDRAELEQAISNYTNQEQDKTYFIKKVYYRKGVKEFLNKYWNRMNEIIVLISERLRELKQQDEINNVKNELNNEDIDLPF